jgi:uncharacterized membrane protein YsdA (DUF1294 family)
VTRNQHPHQAQTKPRAQSRRRGSPYRRYGLIAAVAAFVLAVVLIWMLNVPWFLGWLSAMGAVTFAFYTWDKHRAHTDGGRVPEKVLMAMVLAGGVAGGWAGMLLLRHKTRHMSFWIVQWIATALWAAVAVWLILR